MITLETLEDKERMPNKVFCSGSYTCCVTYKQPSGELWQDLKDVQILIEELKVIQDEFLKLLHSNKGAKDKTKNNKEVRDSCIYDNLLNLCTYYKDLLNIIVLSTMRLWNYLNNAGSILDIPLVTNVDECSSCYTKYLNELCNMISYCGCVEISQRIFLTKNVTALSRKIMENEKAITKENNMVAILLYALKVVYW